MGIRAGGARWVHCHVCSLNVRERLDLSREVLFRYAGCCAFSTTSCS